MMNTLKRVCRHRNTPYVLSLALFMLFFCALYVMAHAYLGTSAFGASAYNTYTLQAMAWRDGRLSLGRDYPWLELAIYQNDWYVSFPPLPSVPLFLLSFIFGADTPDGLLVKLYAMMGAVSVFALLWKKGYAPWSCALWATFLGCASSLFPLALDGGVWYQAQTMAYGLTMLSCALMLWSHPTAACVLYALSVGCRPFNAVYGLPLLGGYIIGEMKQGKTFVQALRGLRWGIAAGLAIACAYGAYNFARFGNPLEFGHNYLPEFSFQGGTQFSLAHVSDNVRQFIFGSPFDIAGKSVTFKKFGFSVFLANPALLCLPVWAARDALRREMTLEKGLILLAFCLHLFLLLLHRTFGGFQFGARYAADLLPYALLYLARMNRDKRMAVLEIILATAALLFCVVGSLAVHA